MGKNFFDGVLAKVESLMDSIVNIEESGIVDGNSFDKSCPCSSVFALRIT
jgi:hypothetical protein